MSGVIITPRLMPGLQIGDSFLSVEPTDRADRYGKPEWNLYLDTPEWEHEESGLFGWGNAREMLSTVCSFLGACAESVDYARRTGRPSENEDLFPPHVAEWAYMNADEISMAQLELDETD